jgi:hypothetical protein
MRRLTVALASTEELTDFSLRRAGSRCHASANVVRQRPRRILRLQVPGKGDVLALLPVTATARSTLFGVQARAVRDFVAAESVGPKKVPLSNPYWSRQGKCQTVVIFVETAMLILFGL